MRIQLFQSCVVVLAWVFSASAVPNFRFHNWPSFSSQVELSYIPVFNRLLLSSTAFDFWHTANELGDKVTAYTENILHDAAVKYTTASEKIGEFKTTMSELVSSAGRIRSDVEDTAEKRGLTLEDLSERISQELAVILQDLKVELSEPLPDDQTDRYKSRAAVVSRVLSKIEDAFVKASSTWGMSEADSRRNFRDIQPHLERVLLITGNIVDNHPVLVETILFSGAALLIPESWLLRPLLSMFGFGPSGPVKGSTAAWAQRYFWGAAVRKGSWFARLQSAGMKVVPPGMWKKLLGSVGAAIGIGGTAYSCLR